MQENRGISTLCSALGPNFRLSDTKTQDAVAKNRQTLAESTTRLSAEIKAQRTEIGWRSIAGFRNIIVHDYLQIDLDETWDIIVRDLPALKIAVHALLGEKGVATEGAPPSGAV